MQKKILAAAAFVLMAGTSAYAEVNLNVDVGLGGAPIVAEPAYMAPAPVVVGGPPIIVNDPHHRFRRDDSWYWQEQRDRAAWEHSHPHGHWDHNGWMRDHHH